PASPPRDVELRRARLGLGRDRQRLYRLVRRLTSAIHAVAELLARAEQDAALRLDRNHLSGLRVAAVVALVVLDVERANAADFDVVSPAQCLLHRVEDRLDGQLRLLLGELALGHEDGNEVALQHGRFSDSRRAGAPKTNDE